MTFTHTERSDQKKLQTHAELKFQSTDGSYMIGSLRRSSWGKYSRETVCLIQIFQRVELGRQRARFHLLSPIQPGRTHCAPFGLILKEKKNRFKDREFQSGSTTCLGADFFPAERTLDRVLDDRFCTQMFIQPSDEIQGKAYHDKIDKFINECSAPELKFRLDLKEVCAGIK